MGILESLRRDASYVAAGARVAWRMRGIRPDGVRTAADLVEQRARETPDAEAIRFEGRSFSWDAYDRHANRFASWARGLGIRRGDVVALLMDNRPEFLFCWMGLAKIGAIGALINSHLTGSPLAHCLRVSGARVLVLGAELGDAWESARELLEEPPSVWWCRDGEAVPASDGAGHHDLDAALAQASDVLEDGAREGLTAEQKLFYIYTSGTTGDPKAANVSHYRFLQASTSFGALCRATERDRIYVVLPLYHSAGGVCAVGIALTTGAAIVLRRKFSASQFFDECRREGVTVFQYIGELCRYLVNAPPKPDETSHAIRVCIGNGLRPDVWERFQERFRIPRIIEFYGATEGNVALVNADGKAGAIGRIPPLLDRLSNVELVRFDVEAEAPIRGPDGFCIACGPDEVGEAIGTIPKKPNATLGRFEGYTDEAATDAKILSNAFAAGDAWFRTGDLLRRDADGYFYFVDRIGDTFRWKGENVSTNEVAAVLGAQPGVKEANVYGVAVPGADGRAGMASLVVDAEFDLGSLHDALERELASYARPLFVRLTREMQITGTFKHRKVDLVEQGFDPSRVPDLLYFDDPDAKAFVPLDAAAYRRIREGQVRI